MKKYVVKTEVTASVKLALVELAQRNKRSLKKQVEHMLEAAVIDTTKFGGRGTYAKTDDS